MKRVAVIVVAMSALVLAAYVGSSFAWFTAAADASPAAVMGRLRVEVDYQPEVAGEETGFVLRNTGDLPCYVRIGYSFSYHDAAGNPLLKDVSGISLGGGSLDAQEGMAVGALHPVAETDGYAKLFVVPLREDGGYYRLSPGESLTARYPVGGVSLEEGQSLRVAWVAEALQCSEAALAEASAYGWNPALA